MNSEDIIDEIEGAMMNVHDMDVSMTEYARAAYERMRELGLLAEAEA